MAEIPDDVAIFRKAHELSKAHGRAAHSYAAKLASAAAATNETEEQAFWEGVEAALRPR